ncbi:MAG: hypothetical protein IJD88_08030 [Clostridia bacterium]|nr:hypothetical protein [Clostridia bacterium]
MKGIFGDLFDFNGDGKLDVFEKAAEFAAFMNLIEEDEDDNDEDIDFDEDEF